MARNKISDLRDHLFETIEALKDPDKPMELERARTISAVAQTIINSAKVEVELVKAVNDRAVTSIAPGTHFFDIAEPAHKPPLRLAAAANGHAGDTPVRRQNGESNT